MVWLSFLFSEGYLAGIMDSTLSATSIRTIYDEHAS